MKVWAIRSRFLLHTSHYENVPFELPEGWVWCKITDITSKITDGTHNSPPNHPIGTYKYVTAKNIKYSGIDVDNITYVDSHIHSEIYSRCNPEYGDILYIKDGATTGVVTINNLHEPFSLLSSVALIKPMKGISNKYLQYYLQSSMCYDSVRESMKGVGITRITLTQIENWYIPLPPYSQQVNIANKIEELFGIIDSMDNDKESISRTIKNIKTQVLDLAISGKLVSQDPTDVPAIELLKRMNPSFTPADTSHYQQLPKGWTICKLEDILDYEQPQAYIVENTDYSDDYTTPVLTAGKSFIIGYTNENFGICNNLPVIIFDDFTTDSKLVNFPFKVKSSAMKILRVKGEIDIQYIAYFMSVTRLIGDTHKRYWISEYSKIEIPLPPFREQQRIVTKVFEIFKNLDNVTAEL